MNNVNDKNVLSFIEGKAKIESRKAEEKLKWKRNKSKESY